ncbi:hypothetical protein Tco_0831306 [Tanacetum coccineum]
MLTAIAGRRWLIGHGLRVAVLKCAESLEVRQAFVDVVSAGLAKGMCEGLQYGIEHEKVGRDLGMLRRRHQKPMTSMQSQRPLGRERRDIIGGCHYREYKPGGEEKEMQSGVPYIRSAIIAYRMPSHRQKESECDVYLRG